MTYKQLASKALSLGERVFRFIASTPDEDRDHDRIEQRGWSYDNFLKNPICLWAHDYSGTLPIGKVVYIGIMGGALVVDIEFATHPFAEEVFQLVKAGFLNAVSVGFRPITSTPNYETGGTDFQEQELLEVSIVPVPANPAALIQRSLDTTLVRKWAERVLSKEGRVLSGENEQHVREAAAHCEQAAQHCNEVLASLPGGGDKPYSGDDNDLQLDAMAIDDLPLDGEGGDKPARVAERCAAAVKKHLEARWRTGSSEIDLASIPPLGDGRGRSPRKRPSGVLHASWTELYGRAHGRAETGISPHEARELIDEVFRETIGEILRDEISAGIARGRGRVD
jgi:HK97 family phage prohead protease